MGNPEEEIKIDYERVDEIMEKMKNAIDTFNNQHTDIFKEDITNLFNMNSDFVEQERKILEALTYRVGTTIISDMKAYREELYDKYIEIQETDQSYNKENG